MSATATAREKVADLKAAAYKGGSDRQAQTLVDASIGVMIAAVVIGAVAIPIVQDVVATANVSGTNQTILDFVVTGLALSLFVAAISLVR